VIFPPWINRFYILDLTPEKSFVKWCVDQGISCSWSAGNRPTRASPTRRSTIMCSRARSTRSTRSATCSASRRPRDRLLRRRHDARGDARLLTPRARPRSSQRDLLHRPGRFFRGRRPQAVPRRRDDGAARAADRREGLSRRPLHGRDLQPAARPRPHLELCRQQLPAGRGAAPFDLLHWNSDTTNLPAAGTATISRRSTRGTSWSSRRDQASRHADRLGERSKTPTYVQAGREDHIAPPQSVWKIMDHFRAEALRARRLGPYRRRGQPAGGAEISILGQRGKPAETLDEFVAGATEHKGSWWPDWLEAGRRRHAHRDPRPRSRPTTRC
jgi:polyhydroxyalkanoate synthase